MAAQNIHQTKCGMFFDVESCATAHLMYPLGTSPADKHCLGSWMKKKEGKLPEMDR